MYKGKTALPKLMAMQDIYLQIPRGLLGRLKKLARGQMRSLNREIVRLLSIGLKYERRLLGVEKKWVLVPIHIETMSVLGVGGTKSEMMRGFKLRPVEQRGETSSWHFMVMGRKEAEQKGLKYLSLTKPSSGGIKGKEADSMSAMDLHIKIPEDLSKKLRKVAQSRMRSINSEVFYLLSLGVEWERRMQKHEHEQVRQFVPSTFHGLPPVKPRGGRKGKPKKLSGK